ncbi:hypothetical protein Dsin_017508 [Dipteronia sinensis]|uniref:Uncharacterized protein n=1 Tax=Dipteronia sinensis TaxID=43782 RepID=A0AAE0AGD5_9ROSI|nr:hypothetical protein Dsin_017508 [Dipteronia sinensis]
MPSHVIGEHLRIWLLQFVGFVVSHCQSKEIHDFELKDCYFLRDADLPCLREWMCFAIERNVHNLTLKVEIRMERLVIRIPQTILSCKNMMKLNLGNWDAILDMPDSTLLRVVNHAKFLSLSVPMTGVLTHALEGNLPSFPNLIRLEFGYDMFRHWVLLPDFLNNSPNMVVLILKKVN